MHHALSFSTFIFTSNVPSFPFYLINRNRQQVLLIKWAIIFLRLKNIFCSFWTFWKWSYSRFDVFDVITWSTFRRWSMLWKSTLKTALFWRNLTLFGVVNFNVDIHNIISTLIWHCATLRRHITLTTTLKRWNVFCVLKNVAKEVHNYLKFIKLKT